MKTTTTPAAPKIRRLCQGLYEIGGLTVERLDREDGFTDDAGMWRVTGSINDDPREVLIGDYSTLRAAKAAALKIQNA